MLDAAQRAGLEIPYSCRKGVCGTCKGRVVSGEVRAFAGDALGAAERAQGMVLFCNARPRSDLAIEPRSISKADPFARKRTVARVFRLQKLADDVMLVHLRFPAGIRVRFKAGQHLNLILANGERRDFSMANPPRESDGAQLHIRHVPGGAFTDLRVQRAQARRPSDGGNPVRRFRAARKRQADPVRRGLDRLCADQLDHPGHGDQRHRARHDAVLGRATALGPLFRPAGEMGGAEPALQIRSGALR